MIIDDATTNYLVMDSFPREHLNIFDSHKSALEFGGFPILNLVEFDRVNLNKRKENET